MEYERIEGEIRSLEDQLHALAEETERSATDYEALEILEVQQRELEQRLEEKMDRWMYLSELDERIRAQKE